MYVTYDEFVIIVTITTFSCLTSMIRVEQLFNVSLMCVLCLVYLPLFCLYFVHYIVLF